VISVFSDCQSLHRSLSSGFYFWGIAMLSIEYVHKRVRLFRIELSLVALACLGMMLMLWQLLMVLRILK
jgi:hypothetical protein